MSIAGRIACPANRLLDSTSFRPDRLLAAAVHSQRYADTRVLKDVTRSVLDDIQRFFVAHNGARGERFDPKGQSGTTRAMKVLEEARRRFGG
jgi:hypothetical protein